MNFFVYNFNHDRYEKTWPPLPFQPSKSVTFECWFPRTHRIYPNLFFLYKRQRKHLC